MRIEAVAGADGLPLLRRRVHQFLPGHCLFVPRARLVLAIRPPVVVAERLAAGDDGVVQGVDRLEHQRDPVGVIAFQEPTAERKGDVRVVGMRGLHRAEARQRGIRSGAHFLDESRVLEAFVDIERPVARQRFLQRGEALAVRAHLFVPCAPAFLDAGEPLGVELVDQRGARWAEQAVRRSAWRGQRDGRCGSESRQTVGECGVRVVHRGRSGECTVEPALRIRRVERRCELRAVVCEGHHCRRRFVVGTAMDGGPVLLVQEATDHVDGRQCLGRGRLRGESHGGAIRLVLVGARERERPCVEERAVPAEERGEEELAAGLGLLERAEQAAHERRRR